MVAARYGSNNVVAFLAPIEAKLQDDYGISALMMAASYGRVACIPFLLSECSLADREGRTALHKACEYG